MARPDKKSAWRGRNGYALIVLLVIIALGVLAFVLQKTGVLARRPTDPNAKGIMPWTEWDIRQMIQAQGQEPPAVQRQIGSFQFDGNVRQIGGNRGSRGEIQVYVSAERVWGGWGGYYHGEDGKQYDIAGGSFSGKFYPDKKYVDPNGNEDPSKLYFLCKGEFQMHQTGKQVVRILTGEIYVRGWLGEDNILQGNVLITSNHKDYKEFEFQGLAN